MNIADSAGARLYDALNREKPLQIVGTINAYCALLAENAGFQAIYLSGAGVANACYGLPDLGITTLDNVAIEVRRITRISKLPLLVDADTGWDDPAKTVATLSSAGAAGLHIEDQIDAKRCGHRPGKALVSKEEMIQRLKLALNGRSDKHFVIMARTDAYSVEGLAAAIDRAQHYINAGADMIFSEALTTLDEYQQFAAALRVPLLANITEFGKTPLFTIEELRHVGVGLILYPLSAFRAMSAAAINVYNTLHHQGSQQSLLNTMQTRNELYEVLNYSEHEKKIDNKIRNRHVPKHVSKHVQSKRDSND